MAGTSPAMTVEKRRDKQKARRRIEEAQLLRVMPALVAGIHALS